MIIPLWPVKPDLAQDTANALCDDVGRLALKLELACRPASVEGAFGFARAEAVSAFMRDVMDATDRFREGVYALQHEHPTCPFPYMATISPGCEVEFCVDPGMNLRVTGLRTNYQGAYGDLMFSVRTYQVTEPTFALHAVTVFDHGPLIEVRVVVKNMSDKVAENVAIYAEAL